MAWFHSVTCHDIEKKKKKREVALSWKLCVGFYFGVSIQMESMHMTPQRYVNVNFQFSKLHFEAYSFGRHEENDILSGQFFSRLFPLRSIRVPFITTLLRECMTYTWWHSVMRQAGCFIRCVTCPCRFSISTIIIVKVWLQLEEDVAIRGGQNRPKKCNSYADYIDPHV